PRQRDLDLVGTGRKIRKKEGSTLIADGRPRDSSVGLRHGNARPRQHGSRLIFHSSTDLSGGLSENNSTTEKQHNGDAFHGSSILERGLKPATTFGIRFVPQCSRGL